MTGVPGRARRGPDLDRVLAASCLATLGVTVLYPCLRVLVEACVGRRFDAVFDDVGMTALRNTVLISLASVGTAGLYGSALAFLFARYRFPGHRALSALAYLPFTLPPLVGVLSFYYIIGRDGLLPRLFEQLFQVQGVSLQGAAAVLLIHTYSFSTFFYATVSAALANMDRGQIEVARTLGASRIRLFGRIVLPMLTPALTAAALLTFLSSAASFSAPYFFGQDFPVLSVLIYEQRAQFHQETALALTVLLAAVSMAGIAVFRTWRRRDSTANKGAAPTVAARTGGWLLTTTAALVVALQLAPHLLIVWLAFADHRAWHTEILPTTFTLAHFQALFTDSGTWTPIRNSLWMSAVATFVTVAVGLPAAYLSARRRPWGHTVGILVLLPWALPGTVIAMNLIAAFNDPWLPLYNTVWMLPLAYFVRGLPLFSRMATAAIEPFDAHLLEAGRTLGASRAYCLRHIALPLIGPALAAAAALAFVTNLGEFVSSILLYMPSNIPIAVKINMEWRGSVGTAFAYSVLLMVLVAGVFLYAKGLSDAGNRARKSWDL